jgi:hypothetical protein
VFAGSGLNFSCYGLSLVIVLGCLFKIKHEKLKLLCNHCVRAVCLYLVEMRLICLVKLVRVPKEMFPILQLLDERAEA